MANKLRKSDLTTRVATRLRGSRAQGEAALNAVLASIQEALSNGDEVVLTGFGSFSVRDVKARKVQAIQATLRRQRGEPVAAEPITVEAHRRVTFRAGADLNKAARRR
jgi:DNA-binding protein HU-beta